MRMDVRSTGRLRQRRKPHCDWSRCWPCGSLREVSIRVKVLMWMTMRCRRLQVNKEVMISCYAIATAWSRVANFGLTPTIFEKHVAARKDMWLVLVTGESSCITGRIEHGPRRASSSAVGERARSSLVHRRVMIVGEQFLWNIVVFPSNLIGWLLIEYWRGVEHLSRRQPDDSVGNHGKQARDCPSALQFALYGPVSRRYQDAPQVAPTDSSVGQERLVLLGQGSEWPVEKIQTTRRLPKFPNKLEGCSSRTSSSSLHRK